MTAFLPISRSGKRHWCFVLACLLLLPLTAHAQFNGPALGPGAEINRPVTLTTDPAVLFPAPHEIRLGPGDDIVVRIYGIADYNPAVRISIDGSVQLPLAGVIPVAGLTLHDAENRIAQHLIANGMFTDPQVTIQLVSSPNQVATVIGEVHAVVPLLGQRRLMDVIAAAGGIPSSASHVVTIDRPDTPQPIVVDLGTNPERSALANVPIFAGDTIVIARVGVVYMLGAFKNQGQIALQQDSPLTLLQATALAGGTGFEGKYDDLRIIRTVGSRRELVHVDIKKIRQGKAPDPILQADDIVLLPNDLIKSIIKAGGVSVLLTITSLMIYLSHY